MAKNPSSKSPETGTYRKASTSETSIQRSAATGRFVNVGRAGRFVTTRANQKAAARVMIAASRKAKLDVPAKVTKIANAK